MLGEVEKGARRVVFLVGTGFGDGEDRKMMSKKTMLARRRRSKMAAGRLA